VISKACTRSDARAVVPENIFTRITSFFCYQFGSLRIAAFFTGDSLLSICGEVKYKLRRNFSISDQQHTRLPQVGQNRMPGSHESRVPQLVQNLGGDTRAGRRLGGAARGRALRDLACAAKNAGAMNALQEAKPTRISSPIVRYSGTGRYTGTGVSNDRLSPPSSCPNWTRTESNSKS
jgi:hypothetical protein